MILILTLYQLGYVLAGNGKPKVKYMPRVREQLMKLKKSGDDAPFKKFPTQVRLKSASLNEPCRIRNGGTNGTISNDRTDCMFVGGCYESNKNYCWYVKSDCKTVRLKFDKFIVEEYLSEENTCPYDKVSISYNGKTDDYCDHSEASKDQQVKKFTPKRDPSAKGMYRWQVINSDTFKAGFGTP